MMRAIERATGTEYQVKAIEGGFEVYTLEGEKYKKLKESTFKRNFKVIKEKAEKVTKSQPKPEPKVELEGEDRENMIEKIKKVLNLSKNNPSEEEGMAAALQAQKLMAKYNIHEDEVTLEEIKEEIGESLVEFKHNAHLFAWYKTLASTVARNFRVKTYLDENKDVVFRGFQEDTRVAAEVYKYLYTLGNKLAGEAYAKNREETGSGKGAYNSFIVGYLEGIESTLGEQCTALMLVTPKVVEEDYEVFRAANLQSKKTTITGKKNQIYEDGLNEGRQAVKSRQLKDKKGGKK